MSGGRLPQQRRRAPRSSAAGREGEARGVEDVAATYGPASPTQLLGCARGRLRRAHQRGRRRRLQPASYRRVSRHDHSRTEVHKKRFDSSLSATTCTSARTSSTRTLSPARRRSRSPSLTNPSVAFGADHRFQTELPVPACSDAPNGSGYESATPAATAQFVADSRRRGSHSAAGCAAVLVGGVSAEDPGRQPGRVVQHGHPSSAHVGINHSRHRPNGSNSPSLSRHLVGPPRGGPPV